MANRKEFETIVLNALQDMDPSGANVELTKSFYSSMSDEDFEKYVQAIEEGKDFVAAVFSNLTGHMIDIDTLKAACDKWGVEWYVPLIRTDEATGITFETPHKYIIVNLPVRRQAQMLDDKISLPVDGNHVDELTMQPTGPSKGSSLTAPESLILFSQGLENAIIEFMKFRGGDSRAMIAMDRAIMETGGVDLQRILAYGTKTRSTQVVEILLKGMHYDNNFAGR